MLVNAVHSFIHSFIFIFFFFLRFVGIFCVYFLFVSWSTPSAIGRRLSHMAESSVKVLQMVDAFRLSPCRKGLGNFYRDCPPDIVWSDSLRGYPDNTCTLLACSPCSRHRPRSPGPSTASFYSQKWLVRCIRSVVGPCRPCTPLPVFLSVSGLRPSGLTAVMACEFHRGVVFRLPTWACALQMVRIRGLRCLPGIDVGSVCQSDLAQTWLRPLTCILWSDLSRCHKKSYLTNLEVRNLKSAVSALCSCLSFTCFEKKWVKVSWIFQNSSIRHITNTFSYDMPTT